MTLLPHPLAKIHWTWTYTPNLYLNRQFSHSLHSWPHLLLPSSVGKA